MDQQNALLGRFSIIKVLLTYLKPYKLELFGVLAALTFTSSSVLGFGKGLEYLIDKGFGQNNPALLDKALAILIFVIVLLAVATYIRSSLIYIICEKVVADLRRKVYVHIIRLSPGFFEINKTSDIISRLTADTSLLNGIIANLVSVTLRNILLVVGGMSMLIYTSPKLTIYVLVIVPLTLVPIITIGRKVRQLSRQSQDKIAEIGARIEESLNGIKTVQAYVREDFEIKHYQHTVDGALDAAVKRVKLRAALVAMVITFVFTSIGIVLWIGGHDVLAGRMSAGMLSSFIFYSVVLAGSVGALSEVLGDLQRASGATERLFELLHAKSDITEVKDPEVLSNIKNLPISFENIEFFYPARPSQPALSQLSFRIEPGQKIAIVGASGAGKSSIFQLLLRFYEPSSGKLMLGGVEINKLALDDLRSRFAYVSQDPVIFSESAYENIKFGRPSATMEEVREAARGAEISDFLDSLPDGFHTFLGERGTRISGGQAQRIAIARAILKDPEILLLDEATSALDSENEKKVQLALTNLMKGRTTLIIAHRISTVKDADRILVIDNGHLVEQGSYNELIGLKGVFWRLASRSEGFVGE